MSGQGDASTDAGPNGANAEVAGNNEAKSASSVEEKLKFVQEPGWAPIKQEYLDLDHKKKIFEEYLPKQTVDQLKELSKTSAEDSNSEEPPRKKQKLKGRNKQRPRDERLKPSDRLCPSIIEERECAFKNNCKYNHDVKGFLSSKLPDLGESCYLYETFGKCYYGIACRFGSQHLSADNKNLTNEELVNKWKGKATVVNVLPKEVQQKLWKRKYNFAKANRIIKLVTKDQKQRPNAQNQDDQGASSCEVLAVSSSSAAENASQVNSKPEDIAPSAPELKAIPPSDTASQTSPAPPSNNSSVSSVNSEVNCGSVPSVNTGTCVAVSSDAALSQRPRFSQSGTLTDEGEIRIRPVEKRKIDFADKLYLAPLTTVGNLPFRRIAKELGADITCSEMALSVNLLNGSQSEWALLKRHPSEDLFGVQLCGSFPDSMTRCAQLLSETVDIDFIDINLGCPIDFIFKRGEGSAMMGRQTKLGQVVRGMQAVTDLPITAKIRTGIFEDKFIAHKLVPKLRDWGISMTTIHGRSREQRYTKLADWDYIDEVVTAGGPMPIFGNGDILSFEDAKLHREQTGVAGLMMARGALIKPWIFTEIKEQRHWDISASERFDLLRKYANYGLEHWGSDTEGVAKTRRFLLEWLSFLHRYVPVGILERLPQRINEKPPHYFGRSDLETLLGSANCGDWIKISEMLLGPVPESFTFLPKHKANAYN